VDKIQKVFENVEKHRALMLEAERYIWQHPESGFKEWGTTAYLKEKYEALGYTLHMAGDVPGFYTDLDTGRPGPRVLVLGEMDSLIIPEHPEADPETGCVHACGHHCQSAALLGLAAALKEPGALEGLCGTIRLMAVPAEELVEIEFREDLRQKGVIGYYGGKQEFLRRGYMDGVDMAFMFHTSYGEGSFELPNRGDNGCVFKTAEFFGKAAHAGANPHMGINALTAARLAMTAMDGLRESFKQSDYIRTHPILHLSGGAVNVTPARVLMENQVRAATMEALRTQNSRVNRAVAAAAAAMGATVKITDRAGYMPLINDPVLSELVIQAANLVDPDHPTVAGDEWSTGCTDLGDLSSLFPCVHPYAMGAAGPAHSATYTIADPEKACVNSAKAQAVMLELLLAEDAAGAKRVLKDYKPLYTDRETYLRDLDRFMLDLEGVTYTTDGTAILKYED